MSGKKAVVFCAAFAAAAIVLSPSTIIGVHRITQKIDRAETPVERQKITAPAETGKPEDAAPLTITHADSSMDFDMIAELDGVAVFWPPTGDKIHMRYDCRTYQLGVVYAGTLDQAREVRPEGWCGDCTDLQSLDDFVGNANATSDALIHCYTYSDYKNNIPCDIYNK